MIRINLLGEKIDRTGTFLAHGLALAGAIVATTVFCFLYHDSALSDLDMSKKEQALLESQLNKLREKTKKVDDLEKNKKLLSEKLTTIARLKAKKSAPVHLLNDITINIPDRSWLTSIKQKPDGLEFEGVALDPQTVSTFMTQLGTSKYIGGVELTYSRQAMHEEVAVQEFAFLVKLSNPLDAKKPADPKAKGDKDKDKDKKKDNSKNADDADPMVVPPVAGI